MNPSLTRRTFITALAASALAPAVALAKPFQSGGVAIRGYDPVAYFTAGKPVKGSSKFTADWQGVKMHFSSARNRDLFRSNPTKYAPKYGGNCAYAAAKGYIAPTVPEAWSIVGGRLYLNYSLGVRRTWEANKAAFIKAGDKNWPNIR